MQQLKASNRIRLGLSRAHNILIASWLTQEDVFSAHFGVLLCIFKSGSKRALFVEEAVHSFLDCFQLVGWLGGAALRHCELLSTGRSGRRYCTEVKLKLCILT